ncbi:MAG TPA: 2-C-methyl-D-erythritol 2,4-cyclodiphosphate synthase, partial [Aquificaceae bacterium]|nr:2-C-methyl-D-erythritol 2,4-cyclodiphosphate synthase [Aquificaceae bacterium]
MDLRIGLGFDSHEFEAGKKLILGGVEIEYEYGLKGHSDGDALLHAITDAILAAIGEKDIGEIFKDTDPRWKNAPSSIFLKKALELMKDKGFKIINLDCTIIADKPKIAPDKDEIKEKPSQLIGISKNR